jgi:hypothetical protein
VSGTLTRPDWAAAIKDLGRRVRMLERRITPTQDTDRSFEITFSFAGTITATESPPKRLWRPGHLTVLAVTLTDAGSTDTVIDIERNGTVVDTVTIPAGAEDYDAALSIRFAADDRLRLLVTSAGTGAAEMTCDARFTPRATAVSGPPT